jgi:universal stress protein E
MPHFKNVLVVIDPTEDNQKAFSRALELAEKQPINITVFLTIYDFSYEMTTMLSNVERDQMRDAVIKERSDWLAELIEQSKRTYQEINTKVVWHNRPFESIIRTVIAGNFDLVIKSTHSHDHLRSVIFTPTDWHLLRKCPCSVLLVKEHAWPENGRILAAVAAGSNDNEHSCLNDQIVSEATHMASLLKAQAHLINAYPPTPVNISVELPEFDAGGYIDAVKKYHQETMGEIAKKHKIAENQCHVYEGMPEDVIPRAAKELDAELVVVGTIGRRGFSAALIGNTAEHVIDNLECDLLAIKHEDFECPIKL